MAGRGCTITIKILGGSSGNDENEDMSLPIALHSPLIVLREQLADLIGIPLEQQVLILCDLTDVERNHDRLLTGLDHSSLRTCGIESGSVLTLHALSMSAERKQKMAREALSNSNKKVSADERPTYILDTEITAANANHSYNGVIFDVSSDGPYEIEVVSVFIAGMLGRVRVFTRDSPWEQNKPTGRPSPHWWAHRENMSKLGWIKVADLNCRPSWDKPIEIKFSVPLKLLPHTRKAIYCHSGLPDDLGIQYQSYPEQFSFANDEYVSLHPGLGHTGSEPFEDVHGWYRGGRGLAGSIRYRRTHKGWSIFEHHLFPEPLQEAVKTLLLCQNRTPEGVTSSSSNSGSSSSSSNSSSSSSSSGAMQITDAEEVTKEENENSNLKDDRLYQSESSSKKDTNSRGSSSSNSNSGKSTSMVTRSRSNSSGSGVSSAMATIRGIASSLPSPSQLFRSDRIVTRSASSVATAVSQRQQPQQDGVLRLHRLHVHILYYIMEFMDWDWFDEGEYINNEEVEDEEEEGGDGISSSKKPSLIKRASNAASSAAQMMRQAYINNYLLELLGQAQNGANHGQQFHHYFSNSSMMGNVYYDDDNDDEDDDDEGEDDEYMNDDEEVDELEEEEGEGEGESDEWEDMDTEDEEEGEEEKEGEGMVQNSESASGGDVRDEGTGSLNFWSFEPAAGDGGGTSSSISAVRVRKTDLSRLQPTTILDYEEDVQEEEGDEEYDTDDMK